MNFLEAIKSGFSHYVTFSGRAIRSEYWYWALFALLGGLATEILDAGIFATQAPTPLNSVFYLLTILPSLAISVRRLHDIDRTGWWVLITFSLIGVFLLIYWACKRGTPGPNRFGPDPFGADGHVIPLPVA